MKTEKPTIHGLIYIQKLRASLLELADRTERFDPVASIIAV